MVGNRIERDRNGGYRLRLPPEERELLASLPASPSGHVLDAGCGLGGTMLDLAGRCAARFTGLTLSAQQAAIGRAAAARAGFTERIAIEVGSYDSPPEGPFESSPQPCSSFR